MYITLVMAVVFTASTSPEVSSPVLHKIADNSFRLRRLLKPAITAWSTGCMRLVTLGRRNKTLISSSRTNWSVPGWVGVSLMIKRALTGNFISTNWHLTFGMSCGNPFFEKMGVHPRGFSRFILNREGFHIIVFEHTRYLRFTNR